MGAGSGSPPNILLIQSDQHRYGCLFPLYLFESDPRHRWGGRGAVSPLAPGPSQARAISTAPSLPRAVTISTLAVYTLPACKTEKQKCRGAGSG